MYVWFSGKKILEAKVILIKDQDSYICFNLLDLHWNVHTVFLTSICAHVVMETHLAHRIYDLHMSVYVQVR